MLRGITVTNHILKGEALRRYETLRDANASTVAAMGTKPKTVTATSIQGATTDQNAPAYRPKPPKDLRDGG